MAIKASAISTRDWEEAALCLRFDTESLWRMAWCCSAAYVAVCRIDDVWERECRKLGLLKSRYDRWHFDTVARVVRQAAFMYCEVPLWRPMPRMTSADNQLAMQMRIGPKANTSVIVWQASDLNSPWIVVFNGQIHLFPKTNGERRPLPDRADLASIQKLFDGVALLTPLAASKKTTSTARLGKAIKDVKASWARLPLWEGEGSLPAS